MFKYSALLIASFCITQLSGIAICTRPHALPEQVVAGYYENWSQYRPAVGGRPVFLPSMIDPTLLTDLNFAFGVFGFVTRSVDPTHPHLTGDFSIQPVEWNDQSTLYPAIMALKSQTQGKLRVFLSIGGWSFNDPNDPNGIGTYTYKLFSQMVSTQANRQQFIDSAIAYSHKYGFDGIDIDWEYPGDLTRGGTPDDFANFVEFLKECNLAFKAQNPPLLLSYASAAVVPSGVPQSYRDNPSTYFQWLAECSNYLDRLNVMAYDYHGAFDVPKLSGVNAPLNRDTNPASSFYIAATLNNYLDNGVPANKVVLGLPTYGRSFGGESGLNADNHGPGLPFLRAGSPGPATQSAGLLAYFEIADMTATKQLIFGTDQRTSTALGWNANTQEWVSFDTPDTITLKAQLAKSLGLQGVMFWAIDMDEYQWSPTYPNIRAANSVFK